MDDLQSDKLWSPTTPAVRDLQKWRERGIKTTILGFYGVLNALGHIIELDSKEEELTGCGVHEARFEDWKRKRMVSLIY